jgi:hypothetical protein
MEPSQFSFHVEEYKSLKQDLLVNIRDSYQAALLSIAGNAALISYWLNSRELAQRLPAGRLLIPLMSVTICLFGLVFYALRRRSLSKISSYLKVLEGELAAPKLGWESFYQSDKAKRLFFVRTTFVIYLLFIVQFALVAVFALILMKG